MTEMLIWVGILIVLIIAEAATVNMISIWFAVGSLAAIVAASLGAQIWLQVLLCLLTGSILLLFTRKWALERVNAKRVHTNLDRVIGEVGVITETVENIQGTGTVKVQGKLWTARSQSGEKISVNVSVKILRIDGVKLWVEALAE